MTTQLLTVPLGTTSAPFPVIPGMSVCAGPLALSGTVLIEWAPTADGPWTAWQYGIISQAGSIRFQHYRWARVTAATKNATVAITDLGDRKPIVVSGLATASATTEQVMYSLRIPPGYLTSNFSLSVRGSVSATNAAHVKTIAVKVNGVGGTSIFTSPDLQSELNYNFSALATGYNNVITGFGAGASGGVGVSTTAYTSLAFDYLNNELEVVVTGTKATAAEVLQIDGLVITITP